MKQTFLDKHKLTLFIIMLILLLSLLVIYVIYINSMRNGHNEDVEKFAASSVGIPTEMILINMDSKPERLENFKKFFYASDCSKFMQLKRVSAVVGKEVDWKNGLLTPKATADMEQTMLTGKRKGHESLTLGAIGCYLSHINVIERIVKNNQPAIICEDDLELSPNFYEQMKQGLAMLPTSENTLLLFHVFCTGWEKLKCTLIKDNFYEVHKFWSTACYYVTPSAAKTILLNARPLAVQIDSMYSQLAKEKLIHIYAYPIVETQPSMGSDIQIPIES